MSKTRTWIGPSESQANAEALARRGLPYSDQHGMSARFAYDVDRRQPRDLRDAVRMARKAYQDEVPTKLHEGPDSIGEDGTPKMTARAVGYLFGDARSDDAGRDPMTGERDLLGYYHSPFRAALARWEGSTEEADRKRAAIVSAVTIGGQGPTEAAMHAGVPLWLAKHTAEWALRSFLRGLTDIRVHVPTALPEADAVA